MSGETPIEDLPEDMQERVREYREERRRDYRVYGAEEIKSQYRGDQTLILYSRGFGPIASCVPKDQMIEEANRILGLHKDIEIRDAYQGISIEISEIIAEEIANLKIEKKRRKNKITQSSSCSFSDIERHLTKRGQLAIGDPFEG